MKNIITKRAALFFIVAVILGLGSYNAQTIYNVTPCVGTAGCDLTLGDRGDLTTQRWGFPAVYREVTTFRVNNTGNYRESRVNTQPMNLLLIATNIFFWFTLLKVVSDYIGRRTNQLAKAKH